LRGERGVLEVEAAAHEQRRKFLMRRGESATVFDS
jgi:hypothetical protein